MGYKTVNKSNLPMIDYRELVPLQGNLKDLTKANYQKLLKSIEKEGFFVPAFVWFNDGVPYILDAHQRHRVLTNENIEFENSGFEIPYIEIEAIDEADAAEKLLKISSQYGTITQEGMDEFIAKYELPEQEIYEATAYDALRFDEPEPEVEVVEDEAPEVDESEPPKSKLGEMYQLGRHRILCGDATKREDVDKLLDDRQIQTIYTDPPYGVKYKSKKLGGIMNDDIKDESMYEFVRDSFEAALPRLKNNAGVYCWYEDKYRHEFQKAIEDAGYEFKQNLVWNKGMNLSGADYQKAHENCMYFQIKGEKAYFVEDRDKKTVLGMRRRDLAEMTKSQLLNMLLNIKKVSTVWDYDKDNVTQYVHPTQKPVIMSANVIMNSSKTDGEILDIFLGSGSTLIACEQTDRTCYGMELDPKYVDVIRKRYAKFISPDNELPENWEELTPAIARGKHDGKS